MKLPHDRRYCPFLGWIFVAFTAICYIAVVAVWWLN